MTLFGACILWALCAAAATWLPVGFRPKVELALACIAIPLIAMIWLTLGVWPGIFACVATLNVFQPQIASKIRAWRRTPNEENAAPTKADEVEA